MASDPALLLFGKSESQLVNSVKMLDGGDVISFLMALTVFN